MLLSRWAILERIGSGGFGSIFKAFDTEKNTNVAIKVVRRRNSDYISFGVQKRKKEVML
jgi:serine/threonine protein kinase